ncbi:MAG: SDR family NAD(P)-dependent oxidoreductase [Pseudomonadota bacterium]
MPVQEVELFAFAANDLGQLKHQLEEVAALAKHLTLGQLASLAARRWQCRDEGPHRAWVGASRPDQLVTRLERLARVVENPKSLNEAHDQGGFGYGKMRRVPRLGFLFPGQAAPVRPDGGQWARRFESVRRRLQELPTVQSKELTDTALAQPAIVAASVCALELVEKLGVYADVAIGHSLGELMALSWSGAVARSQVISLAAARGRAMASCASGGAMVRVAIAAEDAAAAAASYGLSVACVNGEQETVLAGPRGQCEAFAEAQRALGIDVAQLAVSDAFHSEAMVQAQAPLAKALRPFDFGQLRRQVVSTVRGAPLAPNTAIEPLLLDQLVSPVLFTDAVGAAQADLWVELGPGAGLGRLVTALGGRSVSVDACDSSLDALINTLGALWVNGVALELDGLFDDRQFTPLDSHRAVTTLRNPCAGAATAASVSPSESPSPPPASAPQHAHEEGTAPLLCLRTLVAEELDLPVESLSPQLRFLDDLHMNSLAVARVTEAAASRLGIRLPAATTDYANASLEEVADQLQELAALPPQESALDRIEGVAPWVESYAFHWQETSLPEAGVAAAHGWRVEVVAGVASVDLSEGTGEAPDATSPRGVVLFMMLPPDASEREWREGLASLWQASKHAAREQVERLAVVHCGAPVMAWARSLVLEQQFKSVVDIELDGDASDSAMVRPLLESAAQGFTAWRIRKGRLMAPQLRRLQAPSRRAPGLQDGDTVLVTGGAKGIGAECALRLAERTGVRLALLGRSRADCDEVKATLARAQVLGISARYFSADVTNAQQVAAVVKAIESHWGHVQGLIHAAGINEPAPFDRIEDSVFDNTMAVKVAGLDALLQATANRPPKVVITFGSIIGCLGLAGETHYALANAAQSQRLTRLAARHPNVRTLNLDWSVWGTVGMGERLGTLERLRSEGVHPLPLDRALEVFERLLASDASGTRIVTNRFGHANDIDLGAAPLPLHRYLESVRVHYPGLELVVDVQLSRGVDLYLEDHLIDGKVVLPGVMMLEAMATAARALWGRDAAGVGFEQVRFDKSISFAPRETVTVRIAALVADDGAVTVHLRCTLDGFASVYASARVREESVAAGGHPPVRFERSPGRLINASPLYDTGLFFNRGRFACVGRYDRLGSRELSATLAPREPPQPWFAPYQPQALLLGDPGRRDSGLHALQSCVPQRRVVPLSVDAVQVRHPARERVRVEAVQRWADQRHFVFDLQYFDADDQLVEHWQEVRFAAVAALDPQAIPDVLSEVWLERELALRTGRDDLLCAVAQGEDQAARRAAVCAALRLREFKGRESDDHSPSRTREGSRQWTLSDCQGQTLLMAAKGAVGSEWARLGASKSVASTARRCVREALAKVGALTSNLDALSSLSSDALFTDSWTIGGFDVLLVRAEQFLVAVCLEPPAQHRPSPSPADDDSDVISLQRPTPATERTPRHLAQESLS